MNIWHNVNLVKSVALPSILQSIQTGMKLVGKSSHLKTTLTEGMEREAFAQRHEILETQHRMHPDISKFPRETFYDNNALLNNEDLWETRNWDYKRYEKHSVWMDVVDSKIKFNKNHIEANLIINELKRFMAWTKNNPSEENKGIWEVAILTFYRGQESLLREKLVDLMKYRKGYFGNRFGDAEGKKHNIYIKLNTVDKFQGQEADLVFLSMVQNHRVGFMDSPNRLNVAITRAKFQLVIVGNKAFFQNKNRTFNNDSRELQNLARYTQNNSK